MRFGVLLVFCILFWNVPTARAEVGVVVYESKGVDSRRTNSGHIALIATDLCAEGIDQVRSCQAGEEPGVVLTRYLNLAYGHAGSVFAAPLRAHFSATSDAASIPTLTDDNTLEAMQIAYWREHLRPYLPPLSPEEYQKLSHRFDPARTVKGILSLESVLGALEPSKNNTRSAVALVDPVTKELIPNGNWREAIGAAHVRSSIRITAPATVEQETRLIPFVAKVNKQPFQALADNCSDFVERGLLTVFGDSGLRFRPRIMMLADAWVTNPLAVMTDFVSYADRERIPLTIVRAPMIAGTRRPTAPIHSLTRGALVPDPSQGKLLFGAKLVMNAANPLLGVTAYTVDKLSRFADLERLAHERGGGDLSQISYELRTKGDRSGKKLEAWHREQVKVFGTTSCWKAKEDAFRALAAEAYKTELLSGAERGLLLRRDRPFLLPRWYAHTAAPTRALPFGAGRNEISRMADVPDRESSVKAFRVMLSVINYDLSSEPSHRRSLKDFDQDWTLFLRIAEKNGVSVPPQVSRESLEECSCREFDLGTANRDAFGQSLGFWHELVGGSRETVFGRTR